MPNSTFPRVILITGTPGVGKTSVGNCLINKGYNVIFLNDFIIHNGIYYGYDLSRESVIVDEEYLEIIIKDYINDISKLVFIEGHTAELLPPEIVSEVIVLRCTPNELRKRLISRGYSPKKIEENVHAEIMEECKISILNNFPENKIIEIDSTFQSYEEIVERILSQLFN